MTKYSLLLLLMFCGAIALVSFVLASDVKHCEQRMSHDACMTLLTR